MASLLRMLHCLLLALHPYLANSTSQRKICCVCKLPGFMRLHQNTSSMPSRSVAVFVLISYTCRGLGMPGLLSAIGSCRLSSCHYCFSFKKQTMHSRYHLLSQMHFRAGYNAAEGHELAFLTSSAAAVATVGSVEALSSKIVTSSSSGAS